VELPRRLDPVSSRAGELDLVTRELQEVAQSLSGIRDCPRPPGSAAPRGLFGPRVAAAGSRTAVSGEREGDPGAPPLARALGRHLAAVELDQSLDHRQAHPQPPLAAVEALVGPG